MRQTPEEMAALFTAFAEAHNAARLDPFVYERAEAERLADLCRANYSMPGLAWRYMGEAVEGKHQLRGIGSFEHKPGVEMPGQIHAVHRLCTCLYGIQNGAEEVDRLRDAKHLSLLLERAQRACGCKTLADTAAGLSETQQGAIVALARLKACDAMAGAAKGDILRKMPGADEDHVKDILRAFADDGTIESNGKDRRWRRYWLSIRGAALAEYLQAVL